MPEKGVIRGMNNIWKRLTSFGATGIVTGTKKEKRMRPYTLAFKTFYVDDEINVEFTGSLNGDIRDFSKYDSTTTVLNVVHKNGKVTVIKKDTK